MFRRTIVVWSILTACRHAGMAAEQQAVPPRAISVLPVFFVPTAQPSPSQGQSKRLMRHLKWSQTRYGELLGHQTTFAIAEQKPRVYRSHRPLQFYRAQPEESAPQIVSELLADLHYNRLNCPFVLLVVMMNPKDDFPQGGGRPLNGGFNTGGGLTILSSFALDRSPYFQSTLQHRTRARVRPASRGRVRVRYENKCFNDVLRPPASHQGVHGEPQAREIHSGGPARVSAEHAGISRFPF